MKDTRLYHTVAGKIGALIDEGLYPPGSRLPAERELAERFGVSRVTVREAEIALQALGRIEIKTGSGVYVTEQANGQNGGLPAASAFEVTQARLLFESEAAALAAREMDDATLATLDSLVETMASTDPRDSAAGDDADRDFHLTIARATGNSAIQHVIEQLWKMRTELSHVKAAHESICSKDADARGDEHEHIVEALKTRDANAARSAMREHFMRLLTSMLDESEQRALDELRKQASESRERFLKSANL
ncbi:MAG: FadR/GntR family transcriptional regulator [Gammaproteobacteria bacterium]